MNILISILFIAAAFAIAALASSASFARSTPFGEPLAGPPPPILGSGTSGERRAAGRIPAEIAKSASSLAR